MFDSKMFETGKIVKFGKISKNRKFMNVIVYELLFIAT